ncbi:MAG: hypothetical protein AAF721_04475 [Myxococcota bacterium]
MAALALLAAGGGCRWHRRMPETEPFVQRCAGETESLASVSTDDTPPRLALIDLLAEDAGPLTLSFELTVGVNEDDIRTTTGCTLELTPDRVSLLRVYEEAPDARFEAKHPESMGTMLVDLLDRYGFRHEETTHGQVDGEGTWARARLQAEAGATVFTVDVSGPLDGDAPTPLKHASQVCPGLEQRFVDLGSTRALEVTARVVGHRRGAWSDILGTRSSEVELSPLG